jgi:hypothetical protein
MAVTNMDSLVQALVAGEDRYFTKGAFSPNAVGQMTSLWNIAGTPAAAGLPPAAPSGGVPTSATAGAFPYTNPVAPADAYLGYFNGAPAVAGQLIIYDRLWHVSGLSATATTNTALTPTALTRYTDGAGVQLWAELYGALGVATAATINLQVTDQGGTTAQAATIAKSATAGANGTMFGPALLASGDYGVRAVTGYSWSASQTSIANGWGLTLLKVLASIPMPAANVGVTYNPFSTSLREIADNACLGLMWLPTATTSNQVTGEFKIAKG